MIDALYSLLSVLPVFALAVLPLVVVLPTAPPMTDDARTVTPPRRAGWRISITIGRCTASDPKAST